MKRLFFTAVIFIALVSFSSCSGVRVTHYSCAGINEIKINQKSIPSNFYKGKVQKMHESSIKRQRKTATKADRAGSGTYRYNGQN